MKSLYEKTPQILQQGKRFQKSCKRKKNIYNNNEKTYESKAKTREDLFLIKKQK